MTNIVDLDKHIRDTIALSLFLVSEVGDPIYDNLKFTGRIDYHISDAIFQSQFDTIDQLEDSNPSQTATTVVHIEREADVSNTYTWEVSDGFSYGADATAKFGITTPFTAGIDSKVSFEFTFSKKEVTTTTTTRHWKIQEDIPVPPRTKVTSIIKIEKTQPRVPFDVQGAFTGQVAASVRFVTDLPFFSHRVSFPITQIFELNPLANFRVEGDTVYFRSEGIFTANEGIKVIIDGTERPLAVLGEALAGAALDQALINQWRIDVTPGHSLRCKWQV